MARGSRKYLLLCTLFLSAYRLFASPPDLAGEWSLVSKYFFVDPLHKIDSLQFLQDAVLVFVSGTSVEIYYPQFTPETGITINRKKKYTCEYRVFQKHNEDRIRIDDQEYLLIRINADKYLLLPIQGEDAPLYKLGTPQFLVRGPEIPKVFGIY